MKSAVVLINVNRGQADKVSQALAEMDGISEVFSVAGRFDLVALIRTDSDEKLAELVSSGIASNAEITCTETLIAFQVFSKHDLEGMFSIGLN
ncbi:MAG TPA: AsnC family transcriptional regulator [Spongiibacteraceae bacterium]|nr:AsnC family transcriptional regulator [Spongiibacteraceae bacterium]HCS28350.1 AsnC family transcriptional regulator [Spongiibacteraceae bacterium]|tara:strand:+ start:888 stop:1166 length:279 start_codon:yes stop_codon:yes gene_type:complete